MVKIKHRNFEYSSPKLFCCQLLSATEDQNPDFVQSKLSLYMSEQRWEGLELSLSLLHT